MKLQALAILFACTSLAFADPLPQNVNPALRLDESTINEAKAAIVRGKAWLLEQQAEDGHWSSPAYPALTALPLWALLQSGDLVEQDEIAAVTRAKEFLISNASEDGSIFTEKGGLRNYNTAISMVALHMTGAEDARPVVLKARRYIAQSQVGGDSIYNGGFGYDQRFDRLYADGINTATATEAMALTRSAEDHRPADQQRAEINNQALIAFYDRTKNNAEINPDNVHVSELPEDQGGHFYKPDDNRAGTYETEDGTVKFNSYGSMTYAAMLSYIYADVDRADPRVRSTFDWTRNHWTLDENPGNGKRAYYYFLNILSKGLNAYGQDVIETPDGPINWRAQLIRRGLELQQLETDGTGYWVNAESKWMEADKVLVTSYMLIALQVALGDQ